MGNKYLLTYAKDGRACEGLMDDIMEYTIIVPIFNEAESIRELCERVESVFVSMGKGNDFEILFVDDGSTDATRAILRELSCNKSYLRSIFLRTNFGKSLALMAGFTNARGNFIITMDGDLQDNPEDIPKLIDKLRDGFDLVSGWKQKRQDSSFRVCGSKFFNWVVSRVGGIKLHDFNCGFKIYRAGVIKKIIIFGQYHRLIPLLVHFIGFKVTEEKVSHSKRKHGKSRYPAVRYEGFFDLLSIVFIYKYRFSPLYFFGSLGLMLMVPSGLVFCFLIVMHSLYVLGLGENYMLKITLLLPLATTFSMLGLSIFLTGFLCDFILSHQSKDALLQTIETMVDECNGEDPGKDHST